MPFLSRSRRPRRPGEWTTDRAVTFVVTLAATRSVTLAARRADMSRKAAYGLKARDPAFAAAWIAAEKAAALASVQGDKVEEVEAPPFSISHVHTSPSTVERRRAFAGLVAELRESPLLAPGASGQ